MPGGSIRDVIRRELVMLQDAETKVLEPFVEEIIKQFAKGLEKAEHLLKESAKRPSFEVGEDPVVVLNIRDNLQRLRTMLLNAGSFTAGLWHGPVNGRPGHFTIIARAVRKKGGPVMGRKYRIPDEVIERLWLGGAGAAKCPMPGCGADAQLVVRAGSPVAFALYNIINAFVEYLDRQVIPKLASETPISEWLDLVKHVKGDVTKIKLWRVVKMSLDRHGEIRLNSIEALAGLRPVMYCPKCGLVDETPGSHGNKCPRCGVPLVGVAVSKANIAKLAGIVKKGKFVEVARFNSIEKVPWSDYVRHVRGRTDIQRDMYVITSQLYKLRNPGVYTVLIIQDMLDVLEPPSEKIVNALRGTEGSGRGVLLKLVWRRTAKLLLNHAAIVAGIVLDRFRGLPPTVQRAISEGHGFTPPLVDVEPTKALERGAIAKVAKYFEEKYGIDIAKSWEEYQWLRDVKFGDLLAELRGRVYRIVGEERGEEGEEDKP
jgi:hypothetical protein